MQTSWALTGSWFLPYIFLNLNIEKRHQNGDTACSLCKQEAEDAFHFIFSCVSLNKKRHTTLLNECKGDNRVDRLGVLLFEARIWKESSDYFIIFGNLDIVY